MTNKIPKKSTIQNAVGIPGGVLPSSDFFAACDALAARNIPFLFVTDYELEQSFIVPLSELAVTGIRVRTPDFNVPGAMDNDPTPVAITSIHPVCRPRHAFGVHIIQSQQRAGNSWLANLTFPARIDADGDLAGIFSTARAPYKLLVPGHFTVFSPEPFVRIRDGIISTFPMKGTAPDAPGAAERLLADEKEQAEHITVTDLLRNDLGRVCSSVSVPRYRYLERIPSPAGALLQTSSEIRGCLHPHLTAAPGTVLSALLPAGSVTGAPKDRTVEIIRTAECGPRGYYCGVFGVWDGAGLDSAVMIRFIEERAGSLYFRSGGGITVYSSAEEEYDELIAKIRIPAL